jgi:phosphatidylinositol-3-phosphatase
MMENHDWSQVDTASAAPFISSLIGASPPVNYVAYATNYMCPGPHPSLPNYLWLEAGTNFGVTADGLPSAYGQTSTQHLVTLLQNANVPWKSFQECTTGTDCPLNTETSCSDGSSYAPKHNPMVFFSDVTNSFSSTSSNCISHVRPLTELLNCSGSSCTFNATNVARYNFITPDLCNDMHDCSVATGDAWLAKAVPAIYGWSGYSSSAIFIIWDEGANSGNGPIGNIIISPFAKAGANGNSYTHSSTLRTMQDIFGVNSTYLGGAASATNLSAMFTAFP